MSINVRVKFGDINRMYSSMFCFETDLILGPAMVILISAKPIDIGEIWE